MSAYDWIQIGLFLILLVALAVPIGAYLAAIHEGRIPRFMAWMQPIERSVYRLCGVQPSVGMSARQYAGSLLLFSLIGLAVLYGLQRAQHLLPLNPAGMPAVPHDTAINTSISFVTNTNWQSYGGETTMSHLTQMVGLTVQNFLSAACGMAILAALARGLARQRAADIGNFWPDVTRSTLYVLLPLSVVLALVVVSQGVSQTLASGTSVPWLQPAAASSDPAGQAQFIALGPVASQVAIKQLGTNGGGFFNVNSAHPIENPTPLTNLLQCLAILLLPAAYCFAFGRLVADRRQGWALFGAMLILFAGGLTATLLAEQSMSPGHLEGKEFRFGVTNSALWAVATTAASNGSVNAMHDSFTPIGGLVPMLMMQLGEVVFGGVGSGLYGMILFVLVAVFIAGLMVGRTPEYLGKKIELFDMKMASIAILLPSACVLVGTAITVSRPEVSASITNPLPHGFSQVLYAFSSASNNNGSAFAGFGANTPAHNIMLGIAMLVGRFGVALPVLAIAGSMASRKLVPPSQGTLPTHTPLFVALLIGTVLIVGALTFVPALALGPLAEHLEPMARPG